jgi:hypothetical protein
MIRESTITWGVISKYARHATESLRCRCFFWAAGKERDSFMKMVLVMSAVGACAFVTSLASAQTVTWDRQAYGQGPFYYPGHDGDPFYAYYYPNNRNWSQSLKLSDPNNPPVYEIAPSNWSTDNYPTGGDVTLGNDGVGTSNAPTNLDGGVNAAHSIVLNSLTIQALGGLNMEFSTKLTANEFNFQGDGTLTIGGAGGPFPIVTVNSGGTLTKSGGAGTYALDPGVQLIAQGATISSTSGTLALPGDTSTYTDDTFTATAGAVVDLVASNDYASLNGTFTGGGAGTLRLSGGELDTKSNTTFNFPGSFFQWTGGVIFAGAGGTFTNAGTITIAGPVGFRGAGFMNTGTVIQSGSGTPSFQYGSAFTNAANATYDLRSDLGWTVGGGGGGTPFFNNSGTLLKSAGTGTSTLDPLIAFNNTGGTIQVNTGTLVLPGTGTSTGGSFVVAAGATLNLVGAGNNAEFDGPYTGSGAGTVLLNGGTLSTGSGATFNLPDVMFQWADGTIASQTDSPFTNGGNIAIVGPVGVAGGGFTNQGTITQSGSGTLNAGYGTGITNAATGTYDIQNDLDMTNAGGGGPNSFFRNAGMLLKSAGTGTNKVNQDFTNSGSLLLKSGTLAFVSGFHQTAGVTDLNGGNLSCTNDIVLDGGSLIGTGTITGNVRNNGATVSPGHSPGRITITGNYIQGANGILSMEIGGTSPGTGYDQLAVSGGATLGGTLNISTINGFTPTKGDVYTLISASSFSGQFGQVNISGFGGQVDYSSNGVTITITTVPSQLLNISTRMRVLAGDNVLIGGFIVTGSDAKKVIVRGIGPSLTSQGVPGALADPTLELHDSTGATIASNDNWKDTQQADIQATGIPPSNDLESAIVATLPANNSAYTAILRGKNNTTGVGLVEAYDLDQAANSKLANISTRGFVDTGDNVMIGGFILGPSGASSAKVIARAIGPSLTASGVANALQDPTLELHDANGTTIASDDNWKDTQQSEIEATGIPPTDDRESAIVATLAPGNYTAIVRGKNNTTGVGLVEVYNLQ